jgi:hypothetical protein
MRSQKTSNESRISDNAPAEQISFCHLAGAGDENLPTPNLVRVRFRHRVFANDASFWFNGEHVALRDELDAVLPIAIEAREYRPI